MILMLKLREIRKKCGLTMKELGAEIGVAESTISQYETGKREPDYETLLKLAEYFGTSVDVLLRGEPSSPSPSRPLAEAELKFALFGDSENIDDEDLEDVRKYAEFVKERKRAQQK